jgi:hypothetical protein
MNHLRAYKKISNWRLITVEEFGISYLEGIVNSQKIRSEKLESFNFSKRIAKDYFNQYELGSIDESFAKDLEDRGILFSDLDFESGKKSSTSRK